MLSISTSYDHKSLEGRFWICAEIRPDRVISLVDYYLFQMTSYYQRRTTELDSNSRKVLIHSTSIVRQATMRNSTKYQFIVVLRLLQFLLNRLYWRMLLLIPSSLTLGSAYNPSHLTVCPFSYFTSLCCSHHLSCISGRIKERDISITRHISSSCVSTKPYFPSTACLEPNIIVCLTTRQNTIWVCIPK